MSGIPSWAKPGALLVCIKRDEWVLITGADAQYGKPRYREICTVADVHPFVDFWCVRLEGYGHHLFNINRFRPLVDDANDAETEREIYRRKVHQNVAPRKNSVDA